VALDKASRDALIATPTVDLPPVDANGRILGLVGR
jgi:hypothetical protein